MAFKRKCAKRKKKEKGVIRTMNGMREQKEAGG